MENRVAFLFPGQGSQKVGMGVDFYENFSSVQQVFEVASESIGKDILALCKEGPEEVLKQTVNTQPSIVTVSIAILKAVNETYPDLQPFAVAGHSVGEYSAVVSAGVLSVGDSIKIISKRAELMQKAADEYGKGSMAAVIGLSDEEVINLCKEFGDGKVQPANFNSPGQVVISGEREKLLELIPLFKEKGAKLVKELQVSGPWHSKYMSVIKDEYSTFLSNFSFEAPKYRYFSNVTAGIVNSGDELRALLVDQLDHPVLWTDSIRNIINEGVGKFIELGPGRVLTGLLKRISSDVEFFNISTIQDLENLKDFIYT